MAGNKVDHWRRPCEFLLCLFHCFFVELKLNIFKFLIGVWSMNMKYPWWNCILYFWISIKYNQYCSYALGSRLNQLNQYSYDKVASSILPTWRKTKQLSLISIILSVKRWFFYIQFRIKFQFSWNYIPILPSLHKILLESLWNIYLLYRSYLM